jgi:hypothetical protein
MAPYLLPPELPESQLDELTEYAMSFVKRNDFDLLDTLLDINATIFKEYAYRQGSTTVFTTAFEVYANRRGVCQDFTNLFICLARLLGVPARYVCGYVYCGPRATSDAARANAVQSEASHAWVQLYLPEVGWKGFDPTNGILTQTEHVRVAVGRNYVDATPTSGTIYVGGGPETSRSTSASTISSRDHPHRPLRRRRRVPGRAAARRSRDRHVVARSLRGPGARRRRLARVVQRHRRRRLSRRRRRRRRDLLPDRREARRPLDRQGLPGDARRRGGRQRAPVAQDRLPRARRHRHLRPPGLRAPDLRQPRPAPGAGPGQRRRAADARRDAVARAMGAAACHAVTRFLIDHTACRTVVDPFCGVGTMLAVANAAGLDAVGVELSPKRAARARTLTAADLRDRKAARSSAD